MRAGQDWVGRKDRLGTQVDARALRDDGSQIEVAITNMSNDGCRLESTHMFAIGETVRLDLPGLGFIEAQVRWAHFGAAGVRFVTDSRC